MNRRRIIAFIKRPRLPLQYQEVEYLIGNGEQYIDTEIYGDNNTKVEVDFMIDTTIDGLKYKVFGSREPDHSNAFIAAKSSSTNKRLFVRFGARDNLIYSDYEDIVENTKINVKLSKDGLFINDVLKGVFSDISSFTTPTTIPIFRTRTGDDFASTDYASQNVYIYKFKLWKNDSLILNLVPCYRISDHEAGFYDMLNNVFYYNNGTGAFIVGSDIN